MPGSIQGTDGALYGTAATGGSGGGGTVFKLNTDGTGFTVLQNFDYAYHRRVSAGRADAGRGRRALWHGPYGGSNGVGTVFKLNTDGTGFTVLQNFDGSGGAYPTFGALVQDAGGALYGTATYGGSSGVGTVFKLNTDGTGFTVLKDFDIPRAAVSPLPG